MSNLEKDSAAAPAAPEQPTEMGEILRKASNNPDRTANDIDLLTRAASECDRFYGGMMNWKANAQAKDKQISDWREKALTSLAALEQGHWISVDERLPATSELVLVYSPPTKHDHPGEVNIGFDCIDPNDDDGTTWLNHNEHYEHFCCVAKPEGSIGPSADAPYTHRMPLPAAPSMKTATNEGKRDAT
jgi:hypothetical protein